MPKNCSPLFKISFLVLMVKLGTSVNLHAMSNLDSTRSVSSSIVVELGESGAPVFNSREKELETCASQEVSCSAYPFPEFYYLNDQTEKEDEIFKHLIEDAKKDNVMALYNLGICYEFGYGCEINEKKAIEYCKKAADLNCPEAQAELGVCYLNGRGVKINGAKAFKWLEKAAQQGYADAQCELGYCYRYGTGVEQNDTGADMWFTKAALQGNLRAKVALSPCMAWFFHWVNRK